MHRSVPYVILSAFVGSLAACRGPDLPLLPEIEWSGEHLDYGKSADQEACGGSLEYMDAYVGALKTRLGADPGLRVEYYWLTPEELADECGDGNTGCTGYSRAQSLYAVHPHELVHAVRDGIDPDQTYSFFEEGFASTWGILYDPAFGEAQDRSLISEALAEEFDNDYQLASDWVGYLLAVHGDEPLAEFSDETSWETSYSNMAGEFEQAIGPLESVIDDFVNAPSCPSGILTKSTGIIQCPLSAMMPSGGSLPLDFS